MARFRPNANLYRSRPVIVFVTLVVLTRLMFTPAVLYSPKTSALYSQLPQPSSPIINSIIVPAYHEVANIRPLVTQVLGSLSERAVSEMVIVDDDSQDGTVEEVERLKREGYRVELVVRKEIGYAGSPEQLEGLSGAVLRGFERARGEKLLVMDADLQVSSIHL